MAGKVEVYKVGKSVIPGTASSGYIVGFKTKTGFGTGITHHNARSGGTGCTIALGKAQLIAQGAIVFKRKADAVKASKDPVAACPHAGWVDFAGKRRRKATRRRSRR